MQKKANRWWKADGWKASLVWKVIHFILRAVICAPSQSGCVLGVAWAGLVVLGTLKWVGLEVP